MIENLEALLELQRQGTMVRAGAVLRISQSAVSKRIALVENHYRVKLIQRSGRKIVLTAAGLRLLERVGPILVSLREAVREPGGIVQKKIILGVSESILSSWGAKVLEEVFHKLGVEVEYHAHRSPLVIEKVDSGVYDLGLCAGKIANPRTLQAEPLPPEELVLVASDPSRFKSTRKAMDILSIEQSSATWRSIQTEVSKKSLNVQKEIESFFAIAQLAMAGFGVGLIPIGVALTLGIKESCISHFKPKLYRPIQVVYKKSKLEQSYFGELIAQLKQIRPTQGY